MRASGQGALGRRPAPGGGAGRLDLRRRRTAPAGARASNSGPLRLVGHRARSSQRGRRPRPSRAAGRRADQEQGVAAPSSAGPGAASSARCSPASVGSAIARGQPASRSASSGGAPFAQSGPPSSASARRRDLSDVAAGGGRSSTLIGRRRARRGQASSGAGWWRGEQRARRLLRCGRAGPGQQDRDGRWPEADTPRRARRPSVAVARRAPRSRPAGSGPECPRWRGRRRRR